MSGSSSSAAGIIRELARLALVELDRSTLFSVVSRELRARFHYDRFSIFLFDAEREFLNAFADADGRVVEMFSNTRVAQNTIAWEAIQSRKPVVITDLSSWTSGGAASLASVGLKATVAVPMILKNEVIGTLHMSFAEQPDNIFEVLDFFEYFTPLLTPFLFVVLSDESLAFSKSTRRGAVNSFADPILDKNSPINESLLDTEDMSQVMRLVKKTAKLEVPVLITGETGTGKSMMARWIHAHSLRRSQNFVKVNCPSLSPSLFESEMFGHAKGAFTGAYSKRMGRIELAQNGTLFLDEIGDLCPEMQSKLLQVLEDSCFERVGESHSFGVDVRFISATNINLDRALDEGRLRRDLFFRLSTVIVRMPPLRERVHDIPLLMEYFVNEYAQQWNLHKPRLSKSVMKVLGAHVWPGNIRELRNVASRLVIRSLDSNITPGYAESVLEEWGCDGRAGAHQTCTLEKDGLCPMEARKDNSAAQSAAPACLRLEDAMREHIERIIKLTGGRISGPRGAAALLGIPRSTLQYRMRKLGISQTYGV